MNNFSPIVSTTIGFSICKSIWDKDYTSIYSIKVLTCSIHVRHNIRVKRMRCAHQRKRISKEVLTQRKWTSEVESQLRLTCSSSDYDKVYWQYCYMVQTVYKIASFCAANIGVSTEKSKTQTSFRGWTNAYEYLVPMMWSL